MVLILARTKFITFNKSTVIKKICCLVKKRNIITFKKANVDRSDVFYKEKTILGYPKEYMFDLVADVNNYRLFVPWCLKSDVLKETKKTNPVNESLNKKFQIPESFKAKLEVGYPPIKESYISHVTYVKPKLVKTVAIQTTFFEYINADWKFYSYDHLTKQVVTKDELDRKYECCVVEFCVTFKFRSILYTQFSSLFLDNIFKKMVTAFIKRANDLYGPPKINPKEI